MRWFTLAAAGLTFVSTATSCGSSDTTAVTSPEDAAAGLYVLTTIDNAPLPFTVFSNAAGSDQITSGTIELTAVAHVYSRILNHRAVSVNGTQTIQVSGFGVYTINASSQIHFESRGGDNAELVWAAFGALSGG